MEDPTNQYLQSLAKPVGILGGPWDLVSKVLRRVTILVIPYNPQ